jgi:hypothetical protein
MAYTGIIYDVIDVNSHFVRIYVQKDANHTTFKDMKGNNIPVSLYKYIDFQNGMGVYLLDTPQEEIIKGRFMKYDFTNEFKEGRPILHVQKLSQKIGGSYHSDVFDWSEEELLGLINIPHDHLSGLNMNYVRTYAADQLKLIFLFQTRVIMDLREKVEALTQKITPIPSPKEEEPPVVAEADQFRLSDGSVTSSPVAEADQFRLSDGSVTSSPVAEADQFEAEVQRRLAKELNEQRINDEVQRRLKVMSATKTETASVAGVYEPSSTAGRAEEGINKVFEEWKGFPFFKDMASLLKP